MTKKTSCELEIKFVDCTTASRCCAVSARKGCPGLSKNCACASSQNLDMAFLINKRNKLTVWSSLLTARETAARAGGAHFEAGKASSQLLCRCTLIKLAFVPAIQTLTGQNLNALLVWKEYLNFQSIWNLWLKWLFGVQLLSNTHLFQNNPWHEL